MHLKNSRYLWLTAFAIILWVGLVTHYWPGMFGPGDHLTYAIIARNIARGVGVVHQTTTPIQLARLGHFPRVDTSQSLGWPIVEALFFAVFGANDITILLASGIFWLLGMWMVVLMTRKLVSTKAAFWAGILYITQPYLLKMSFSGLTEPLYVFLLCLLIFLLYDRPKYFLGGVVWGWMGITRPATLFLLPLVFLLILKHKPKLYKWLSFLVGWLLIGLPLFIRQLLLPSDGYLVGAMIDPTRHLELLRSSQANVAVSWWSWGGESIRLIIDHWLNSLFLWSVASYAGLVIIVCILSYLKKNTSWWAKQLPIIAAFYFVGSGLARPETRYFIPLLILVLPLAASWVSEQTKGLISSLLVVVLVAVPVGFSMSRGLYRSSADLKEARLIQTVSQDKRMGAVASDNPGVLAWYLDIEEVLAPNDEESLRLTNDRFIEIKGSVTDWTYHQY